MCTRQGCGIYTFDIGVEESRENQGGSVPLSPQEITLFPAETRPFRQRIPPQKALLHKECGNVATPQEVASRPFKVTSRLLTAKGPSQSPLVLPGFLSECVRK